MQIARNPQKYPSKYPKQKHLLIPPYQGQACTPKNLANGSGIATVILLIQLRRSRCVRQHCLRVVR